uniref:Uncharacterized protein n=1 Tax=Rhizophora mucronata TaxID=61149 RepID=A0A2P2N714_RHIMU
MPRNLSTVPLRTVRLPTAIDGPWSDLDHMVLHVDAVMNIYVSLISLVQS